VASSAVRVYINKKDEIDAELKKFGTDVAKTVVTIGATKVYKELSKKR
jgi:hypothetical protein